MTTLLALLVLAQERADLPATVDTWYRVVQGKRQVGYVHETLRRSGTSPWRYEYGFDSEFELTIRSKSHAEDLLVTAFLDDALSPVEYASEAHANETPSILSLYALRDERRVESGPESAAWVLPARDDVFVLPTLTLYALRQNETLSRPGRVTLRALGKDKEGIEIVLEVGDTVRREVLGKEAQVVPVAFLKPFPAARRETELKEAFVDRFGRILEAVMVGGARIVIARDRWDALEGVGILHRHGRRDPFDKATAMRNAALERARAARGELEPAPAPITLDSLDSDVTAARKLLDDARAHKAAGDDEEARKAYLQAVVNLKAIRELALKRRPEMLPALEQIRDDAELAWDGAARMAREAGALFLRVTGLVDRLDVEALERTQKELHQFRDRIEVERRPEREQIAGWAAEVGTVVVKSRTRQELVRARLDVTGITLGEQVTVEEIEFFGPVGATVNFVRPFAMADVNGRLYKSGDTVEGTSIRVDRISRFSVQFSLRDETRDVGLRR